MPGDTFRDGFIEGFKMMRGSSVAVPACPAAPATPSGQTAFRMGLARGIEAGGGPRLR